MSSSRGITGATKPRPQLNTNSNTYSGRSAVSGRAAGPLSGKNALQTLGKPTSVVRRMPPPATLPSLKAEHGHESSLSTVAQNVGQGWNKSLDNSNETKSETTTSVATSLNHKPYKTDQPFWSFAKTTVDQPAALNQSQHKHVTSTSKTIVQANGCDNREFPPLAASVAATKQPMVTSQMSASEPPKTQRSCLEDVPTTTRDQEEQVIPVVPAPVVSGSNYIGATVRNDVNRKIPDRYYGGQDSRASNARRYDIRQKLAQLSMESKEMPSTPTEGVSGQTDRQSSVPAVLENALESMESETSANLASSQRYSNAPPHPASQAFKDAPQAHHSRGPPEMRSQDVRQCYHQMLPAQPLNELPETAAWNRAAAEGYGDYSSGPRHGYRNDIPSPNVPPLHGRGDSGQQYRGAQIRGGSGQPTRGGTGQRSCYDYSDDNHPPPLMGQRFGPNSNWEDHRNGPQNWNMPMSDDRMQQRQASSRTGGFRGDSRGTSESEPGWYASQVPPHQRRNETKGWNYPEYDGYRRGSNRSRTTSYGEEYEGMYPSYPTDSERRFKNRSNPGELIDDEQTYEYDYPEDYDRQKYHGYDSHQQPYRMLKRNDEKSAEYFGHHAPSVESEPIDEDSAALSQLTRLGRSARATNIGSLNSESPEIASSDIFDSSVEQQQRKTPQQKFNRAPGSGKPVDSSNEQKNAPSTDNIWKKRMEEQQSKQQEDKTKQNRKFDHHFPAISDKRLETPDSEPLFTQTRPNNEKQPPPLQRHAPSNQRERAATTKWDDRPSWTDEVDITQDDDTYEGTRREFYSRQRGGGPRSQNQQQQRGPKPSSTQESTERRQPVPQRRKQRNEPEDAFSNVGEFHAEDYKIEETRGFSGRHNNGNLEDKKEDRQHRQASSKNPEERIRQLKPQRISGARTTWQRQNKNVEEGAGDGDSATTEQRSSNNRNQKTGSQQNRRNIRANKGLTAQPESSGKPIKSPARSENGIEEWETASESGDLHGRKLNRKTSQNRPKTRETNGTTKSANSANESKTSASSTQRSSTNQKNEKPASHTFHQNREEFVKSRNKLSNLQQQHKNTNDSRKNARNYRLTSSSKEQSSKTVRTGLAGFNVNDASVIDVEHLQSLDSNSDNGEFEEVISRKVKRQRQLQQQKQERVHRERQKNDQRPRVREDKQRKLDRGGGGSVEDAFRNAEQTTKPLSSLSPLSATDSGVTATSSTSPPQATSAGGDQPVPSHVSIPAQHLVWNSPSPQIANPTEIHEEPEPQPTVGPIARPKHRIDQDVKGKLGDLHAELAFGSTGLENSNYSFGYEHAINSTREDNTDLQEKLAKIKNFWPGEPENFDSDSLFKHSSLKSLPDVQKEPDSDQNVEREMSTLHEESNRSKSRSSGTRQFSNSQSPLNNVLFINNHNNVNYSQYNSITSYSNLLSDNNIRDFLTESPFGPMHTTSPPVQIPLSQVGRSLGSFVNPTKIYVAANNGSTTASNDWQPNNTDLLNSINPSSPLQPPTAFKNGTAACFTTPPPKIQHPALPLNHSVPPPTLSNNFNFAHSMIPPPAHDFLRFPPPTTNVSPRPNFNPGNCRNQPPPVFAQMSPQIPSNNRPNHHQQQRRPSNTGNNGRQNAQVPSFFNSMWNGNHMKSTFGLF